jgi:hypothetical protein
MTYSPHYRAAVRLRAALDYQRTMIDRLGDTAATRADLHPIAVTHMESALSMLEDDTAEDPTP